MIYGGFEYVDDIVTPLNAVTNSTLVLLLWQWTVLNEFYNRVNRLKVDLLFDSIR